MKLYLSCFYHVDTHISTTAFVATPTDSWFTVVTWTTEHIHSMILRTFCWLYQHCHPNFSSVPNFNTIALAIEEFRPAENILPVYQDVPGKLVYCIGTRFTYVNMPNSKSVSLNVGQNFTCSIWPVHAYIHCNKKEACKKRSFICTSIYFRLRMHKPLIGNFGIQFH